MSSSRSSRSHSVCVKRAAEFLLLELPGDRLHAVGDEHLAERVRFRQQPPAQQRQLLFEQLDLVAAREIFEFGACNRELRGGVQEAFELTGARAHRMISASQLAATRAMRALSSGARRQALERAGDQPADLLRFAIDDDPGLLEQLAEHPGSRSCSSCTSACPLRPA